MEWSRQLPDGLTVRLQSSGNGSPPGVTGGMSTNVSTLWCRLFGEGRDTGWTQCIDRSAVKVRAWWALVEESADVPVVWAECTGETLA
jgi:hypothetical protein